MTTPKTTATSTNVERSPNHGLSMFFNPKKMTGAEMVAAIQARPQYDPKSLVFTSPAFADKLIRYLAPLFQEDDTFLDPCRGRGAFYDALPSRKDWCEIRDGRDFLTWRQPVAWIITNPPWDATGYREIAEHAFGLAQHVVFLTRLDTVLGTKTRQKLALRHGHRLRELIMLDWDDAGFAYESGAPKPGEGFALVVSHFQRHFEGSVQLTYWWK